eukprot:1159920-Pelagomonas_calceolata.AAC.2
MQVFLQALQDLAIRSTGESSDDDTDEDDEVEGVGAVGGLKRGRKPGSKNKVSKKASRDAGAGASSRQRKKMGARGEAGRRHRAGPVLKPAQVEVQWKEYRDK